MRWYETDEYVVLDSNIPVAANGVIIKRPHDGVKIFYSRDYYPFKVYFSKDVFTSKTNAKRWFLSYLTTLRLSSQLSPSDVYKENILKMYKGGREMEQDDKMRQLILITKLMSQNDKTDREKAREAQEARARRWGISPKDGGNITKPSEYANIPDSDFLDPVNYAYPIDDAHLKPALSYWNRLSNREQYTPVERLKMTEKLYRRAVSRGIDVTYDSRDPDQKRLPEDLKRKMKGYEASYLEGLSNQHIVQFMRRPNYVVS